MNKVVTVGLDIAKSVFEVHGIDEAGGVVLRQRLGRPRVLTFFEKLPRCPIGMEAELWPKLGDVDVREAAYRGGWKPA